MSSQQRSHHISSVFLPFSPLAPSDLLYSSLSTVLQSHPVELSWTGLSGTRLPYRGTLCQLNFDNLKTVAPRRQILYTNPHLCQNSRLISFASPILTRKNMHLPLLQDLSTPIQLHATRLTLCIDYQTLSPTTTWTPLAISLDYCSYHTAWRWNIFMFGV